MTDETTTRLDAWITELATAFGIDAAAVDRDLLLDVARDAAHGIARPAAPLSTFLVGLAAGRASRDEPAQQLRSAVAQAAKTASRLALAHVDGAVG